MNLFGAALGGVGQAAQGMAQNYIKQEGDQQLEAIRAENETRKLRLAQELRVAADSAQADREFKDRNSLLDRRATQERENLDYAQSLKKQEPYSLSPGQERYEGSTRIAGNDNITSAEAAAARGGGSGSGSRRTADRQPEWLKLIPTTAFQDLEGKPDHATRNMAVQLADTIVRTGVSPDMAAAQAMAGVQRALAESKGDRAIFTQEIEKFRLALQGLQEGNMQPNDGPPETAQTFDAERFKGLPNTPRNTTNRALLDPQRAKEQPRRAARANAELTAEQRQQHKAIFDWLPRTDGNR